jgi:hypothetical protein
MRRKTSGGPVSGIWRGPDEARGSQHALVNNRRYPSLRTLLAIATLFAAGRTELSCAAREARGQDVKPQLYAYLFTDQKSAMLEKELQEKLPGLTVTVFGRFRDFEDAMATRPPDAVVALSPLLAIQGTPIVLQGQRDGNDWEPYVLVSPGSPVSGSLSGKVIGVVDLLGRAATQEFVAKLLKTPDIKLKRVTKTEDLLPLLQFSAADAVLVPATAVKSMTDRSRLDLRVRSLPDARVGLPAVGVVNERFRDLVTKQIQALDGESNRAVGVDRWRTTR